MLGSLALGRLTSYFKPSRVLAGILFLLAILLAILLILNHETGADWYGAKDADKVGTFDKWAIFYIHIIAGFLVGALDTCRRLIPRGFLGENQQKLKKVNGFGHVFYETSGTVGAFLSTPFIFYFGPVYALIHLPPCFFIATITCCLINDN